MARFATEVVTRLQQAGYQALWAGGCVRDQLLGVVPKDYDVATDATPAQVSTVFGERRTLLIGAAFGVVSVVGPRRAGQVEVATFRKEEGYSDGRHPDRVSFSTAQQDAQRRDFTINGLFYDPIHAEVIDYVGGQSDLEAKVIRCIGNPHERLDEDKLRMLRAVRFATVLGFQVERETLAAVAEHAAELQSVSAERIAAEMRRVLTHARAPLGLDLLRQTGLWDVVLPEYAHCPLSAGSAPWPALIHLFEHLPASRSFSLSLAGLAWPLANQRSADDSADARRGNPVVESIGQRWKLTRQDIKDASWMLAHLPLIVQADAKPWPEVQPALADPRIESLMQLAEATIRVTQGAQADEKPLQYCRSRLAWPPELLNPPPLVDGTQLQALGIPAGPGLGRILRQVRALQLDGYLRSADEALAWTREQTRSDREALE